MIAAGIDCGLENTEVVLWDMDKSRLCFSTSANNGTNTTDEVVRIALCKATKQVGITLKEVKIVATTGTFASNVSAAHIRVSPSQCLATALNKFLPSARTVIDFGAGKTLVVKCEGGIPLSVALNDKCAGGSGIFLEMVAKLLHIELSNLGDLTLAGKQTVEVQSTCAVFAESEIISLISAGKKREDILRAIAYACACRIYPLLNLVTWQADVAMVGGVAKNIGIVKAIEDLIGAQLIVPEDPVIWGALGAVLVATQ